MSSEEIRATLPGTCTIACDVRPEVGLYAHAPVCWQEQVVAERAARQEAERERDEWRQFAHDAASDRDETLAQLATQDQQIAALRELLIDAEWIIDEQVIGTKKFAAGRIPEEWLEDARALLADQPAGEVEPEEDEYRQPCSHGCFGRWGEGADDQGRPMPVPMYCNVNGCDVESPGMAYKPEPATDQ